MTSSSRSTNLLNNTRMICLDQDRSLTATDLKQHLTKFIVSYSDYDKLTSLNSIIQCLNDRWIGKIQGPIFEEALLSLEIPVNPSSLSSIESDTESMLLNNLILQYLPVCQSHVLCFSNLELKVSSGFSHTCLPYVHTRVVFKVCLFNPSIYGLDTEVNLIGPKSLSNIESSKTTTSTSTILRSLTLRGCWYPSTVRAMSENFVLLEILTFFSVRIEVDLLKKYGFEWKKIKNNNSDNINSESLNSVDNFNDYDDNSAIGNGGWVWALKDYNVAEMNESDESYTTFSSMNQYQSDSNNFLLKNNVDSTKSLLPNLTHLFCKLNPESMQCNSITGESTGVDLGRMSVLVEEFTFMESGEVLRKINKDKKAQKDKDKKQAKGTKSENLESEAELQKKSKKEAKKEKKNKSKESDSMEPESEEFKKESKKRKRDNLNVDKYGDQLSEGQETQTVEPSLSKKKKEKIKKECN